MLQMLQGHCTDKNEQQYYGPNSYVAHHATSVSHRRTLWTKTSLDVVEMSGTSMPIWSLLVMRSTPSQQSLEMPCHTVWSDTVEREAWIWSQYKGIVVSQHQLWDEVSQQGTVMHCRGDSGRRAHTNKTVSAPALSISEVHRRVVLFVLNWWLRTPAERQHWRLIAVIAAILSILQPVRSCSSRVCWLPVRISVSSQCEWVNVSSGTSSRGLSQTKSIEP